MKLGKKETGEQSQTSGDVNNTESNEVVDSQQAKVSKDANDGQLGGDSADLIQIINEQQAKLTELTNLVQRIRADFENYRKHTEADMARARQLGEESVVKKLLPIIDVLDTAMASLPDDLADNNWAKGIAGAHKNLAKMMGDLHLVKQEVKTGDVFDHNQHNAIQFEDGEGEQEVIAEVLRPGYLYNGQVLRPAMVKVAKK